MQELPACSRSFSRRASPCPATQAHCDTPDGPVVAAACRAVDSGNVNLDLSARKKGLPGHFEKVIGSRRYNAADVEAGRAHAKAYVEFVHYAERLHEASETLAPCHVQTAAPAHTH